MGCLTAQNRDVWIIATHRKVKHPMILIAKWPLRQVFLETNLNKKGLTFGTDERTILFSSSFKQL